MIGWMVMVTSYFTVSAPHLGAVKWSKWWEFATDNIGSVPHNTFYRSPFIRRCAPESDRVQVAPKHKVTLSSGAKKPHECRLIKTEFFKLTGELEAHLALLTIEVQSLAQERSFRPVLRRVGGVGRRPLQIAGGPHFAGNWNHFSLNSGRECRKSALVRPIITITPLVTEHNNVWTAPLFNK